MVGVAEGNRKEEKKGEKRREKGKKGGEKVPMSGLNPRPPILQLMSLPLNYPYVFIIAIANLIFNNYVTGCARYAYYRFYVTGS